MKHPIRLSPDPVLRQMCTPVESVTPEIQQIVADLFETMRNAGGAGLASPQIGVTKRIFVIDVEYQNPEWKARAFINPEIYHREGNETFIEGCLSFPSNFAEVERAAKIKIRFLDETGAPQDIEATGLLADAIQHEFDHLEGKLYIDYLKPLKRDIIKRKMKKLNKQITRFEQYKEKELKGD